MVSFLFGGETGETPESIRRKREIANALVARDLGSSPRNVGEGLSAIGKALIYRQMMGKADAAEKSGISKADDAFNAIFGSGSDIPDPEAKAEIDSTAPGSTASVEPIDMTGNDVFTEFMDTVKGGVTNPYGLAAVAATGKAESRFDPKNVNRTWSDPSESGKPGRAGGIMSWRGPRYEALVGTGDLSPKGQAEFFLKENPQLIDALNNAKSVEEAQRLMNNAWAFAGYNRPGGESARRLAYARALLPQFRGGTEVASIEPQIATDAIASQAAPSGYIDPMVSVQPPFQRPRPVERAQDAPQQAGQVSPNGGAGLRPFRPGERRDNADGTYSTEITTTWQLPDGSWANIPSLWMGQDGLPRQFSPDDEQGILGAAMRYEAQNGQTFKRYKSAEEAEQAARARSDSGGAGAGAQIAQETPAPQPTPPPMSAPKPPQVDMRLVQVLSNPYLSPEKKAVAQTMLQQQMAEVEAYRQMQMKQSDPAYKLQMEKDQLELDRLRNPQVSPVEVNGRLVNPKTGEVVADFSKQENQWQKLSDETLFNPLTGETKKIGGGGQTGFRFGGNSVEAQALNGLMDSGQLTPDQAQQLGAGKTITGPNGEIIFMTPQGVFGQAPGGQPQPMSAPQDGVDIFGDGGPQQGAASPQQPAAGQPAGGNIQITEPKVTQDEKKAMTFADRMSTSGDIIDRLGTVGTDKGEVMKSQVPFGIGNMLVSDEFQQLDQARRDFINAQLRRESGAVISDEEFDNANKQYFPQPGDSPETIAQKARNRRVAIEGMIRDSGPTYKPPANTEASDGWIELSPGVRVRKVN